MTLVDELLRNVELLRRRRGYGQYIMDRIPGWIPELANAVSQRIHAVDYLPPLGCHTHYEHGVWEITLFVGTVETIGGIDDGSHRPARFTFDLAGFHDLFDETQAFGWQPLSMGTEDELGPHLAVEGTFQGHAVWLRLLARSPESIGVAATVDANREMVTELW